MARELVRSVDPIADSLGHLLVVSFPKSTSQLYPLAANIAEGATKHTTIEVDRKPVHLAAFGRSRDETARALALLRYVSGWKGTQIYAGGRLARSPQRAGEVLDCYLEASSCNDRTAHCHTVIDDPYNTEVDAEPGGFAIRLSAGHDPPRQRVEVDRYLFPCSFAKSGFRFQTDHPASPQDQIQAGAVRRGCEWCPFFDSDAYGKVGTRVASKVVFS